MKEIFQTTAANVEAVELQLENPEEQCVVVSIFLVDRNVSAQEFEAYAPSHAVSTQTLKNPGDIPVAKTGRDISS